MVIATFSLRIRNDGDIIPAARPESAPYRGGQSIDGLGDLRIGIETTLSNHNLEPGLGRRTHTEIHRSAVYRKAGLGEEFRIGIDSPVGEFK